MSGYRPMMDRLFKSILSIREFKIRVDDDYTDRCVRRQMVQNIKNTKKRQKYQLLSLLLLGNFTFNIFTVFHVDSIF